MRFTKSRKSAVMKQIFKSNSPTAVVFGGSGFIGRYIVHRLVRSGYKVRVAVRKPNEALFLKTYGEVGQVEILACSVLDVESVQSCLQGSSIVVFSDIMQLQFGYD